MMLIKDCKLVAYFLFLMTIFKLGFSEENLNATSITNSSLLEKIQSKFSDFFEDIKSKI
jgi:hypothetical protein